MKLLAYTILALFLLAAAVPVTNPSQLYFTAAGTGAVKRSVALKLGDVVSVKDFGTCTGADSTIIQAAITAAGTTGWVLIPGGCVGTYTNPNSINILDFGTTSGTLSIKGKTVFRTADNIRFASEFASGSNTGGIAEAYADCPSTGCLINLSADITISSAQTITVVNNKPFILVMNGRKITFTHTTGVGLTIVGGVGQRQVFSISSGTFDGTGNTNAGITGLEISQIFSGSMRDVEVQNFAGTNQTAMLLDFTEDFVMDTVNFENNNGTGGLALDIARQSNANKYSAVQFQSNYKAIRIRSSQGNWFSDCLVQSQIGGAAIEFNAIGAETNITDTHFDRCWFENNGTLNASDTTVYMNTDAGKTIAATSFTNSHFSGTTNGALGSAFKFAAAGSPAQFFTTGGNYFIGYASISSGLPSGTLNTSLNDTDTTNTIKYGAGFYVNGGTGSGGLSFNPSGGGSTHAFNVFAGWPGNFDGNFVLTDVTTTSDVFRYASSNQVWNFLKGVQFSVGVAGDGGGFKHKRAVAGCATAASIAAVCSTTFTWGTAFADANYTVHCTGNAITSGAPILQGITAKLAASVTVQTIALTAVAAQFTNIECQAVHD